MSIASSSTCARRHRSAARPGLPAADYAGAMPICAGRSCRRSCRAANLLAAPGPTHTPLLDDVTSRSSAPSTRGSARTHRPGGVRRKRLAATTRRFASRRPPPSSSFSRASELRRMSICEVSPRTPCRVFSFAPHFASPRRRVRSPTNAKSGSGPCALFPVSGCGRRRQSATSHSLFGSRSRPHSSSNQFKRRARSPALAEMNGPKKLHVIASSLRKD